MVVHFNTVLLGREFGAHLLSVEKFQNWLDQKGLKVPLDPPLNHWKFIQVEALLCAIERGANAGITDSEAEQLVPQIGRLSGHEHASLVPKWLLGAEAHWNWRERIRQAVKDGELQLLDFVSKLPLSLEQESAAPEPTKAADELATFGELVAYRRASPTAPWSDAMRRLLSDEEARRKSRTGAAGVRQSLAEDLGLSVARVGELIRKHKETTPRNTWRNP